MHAHASVHSRTLIYIFAISDTFPHAFVNTHTLRYFSTLRTQSPILNSRFRTSECSKSGFLHVVWKNTVRYMSASIGHKLSHEFKISFPEHVSKRTIPACSSRRMENWFFMNANASAKSKFEHDNRKNILIFT